MSPPGGFEPQTLQVFECFVNQRFGQLYLLPVAGKADQTIDMQNTQTLVPPPPTLKNAFLPLPPKMWIHYIQVQLLGPLEGNAARKIFQEHNEEKTLQLLTANDPKDDIIEPTQIDGH